MKEIEGIIDNKLRIKCQIKMLNKIKFVEHFFK